LAEAGAAASAAESKTKAKGNLITPSTDGWIGLRR
jgi:hypothetical protein